jgi:hypothetical protein
MAGGIDKFFEKLVVAEPREVIVPGQDEKEPAKTDPEKEKEGKRKEKKMKVKMTTAVQKMKVHSLIFLGFLT